MGKFDGLLLVSDFDDTLYDSHHRVPERNLKALDYFRRQGGRFTVATGRAHRTFSPHVHLVPIDVPVVLSNGSALYDFHQGRMLVQTLLSPTAPQDFGALMDAFPSLGIETYHDEDIFVYNPNPITVAHMKKVGTDYEVRPVSQMPVPWTKAILQQDHPLLLEVQRWLLERYGHLYEAIFSNAVLLECTARTASKGGMVLKLAQLLGVERKDIYCVGDNQNDIPMLAVSAIPFAPANCAQEVKDSGATVLKSCEEDCIAQIVGILDMRYPS